jgi:GNAT superfamily N-acetyltransferase
MKGGHTTEELRSEVVLGSPLGLWHSARRERSKWQRREHTMPGIKRSITTVHIQKVVPERIIDLRHRVLRTGLPVETAHFEGDQKPETVHFAAFLAAGDNNPVGCASFMFHPYKRIPALQLRGMATEEAYRGQGIGKQILEAARQELGSDPEYREAKLMWCNARKDALRFYLKNGWKTVSDAFDIKGAGVHYVMTRDM